MSETEIDFLKTYNMKYNRQQESLRELIHSTNICPDPTLCLGTWGDKDTWVTYQEINLSYKQ